jgi:hypothetical protein
MLINKGINFNFKLKISIIVSIKILSTSIQTPYSKVLPLPQITWVFQKQSASQIRQVVS